MNIIGLRFLTGEDLIGKFDIPVDFKGDIKDLMKYVRQLGWVTLKKPTQVALVPVSQTQAQLSLAPYLPFAANEVFTFSADVITTIWEPTKQLSDQYIAMTTGLVMAGAADLPKSPLIL